MMLPNKPITECQWRQVIQNSPCATYITFTSIITVWKTLIWTIKDRNLRVNFITRQNTPTKHFASRCDDFQNSDMWKKFTRIFNFHNIIKLKPTKITNRKYLYSSYYVSGTTLSTLHTTQRIKAISLVLRLFLYLK